MMKSFLFVIQLAAYTSHRLPELLDEILIAAAFEQKVSLLLLDDAVFQLKKNQQANAVNTKNLGAIYRSLELYDIENIYVEYDSLLERGLGENDLLIPITLLTRTEIAPILKNFDVILGG